MALVEVSFPGGKKVDAHLKGFVVNTDQSIASGGENTAPSPLNLFLASLASCAGVTALAFCQSKGISTNGLKLELDGERDPETRLYSKIILNLTLPEGFPDKYEKAIVRSLNYCSVKKHIATPPSFEMNVK